jgi:hypothetical protein
MQQQYRVIDAKRTSSHGGNAGMGMGDGGGMEDRYKTAVNLTRIRAGTVFRSNSSQKKSRTCFSSATVYIAGTGMLAAHCHLDITFSQPIQGQHWLHP